MEKARQRGKTDAFTVPKRYFLPGSKNVIFTGTACSTRNCRMTEAPDRQPFLVEYSHHHIAVWTQFTD